MFRTFAPLAVVCALIAGGVATARLQAPRPCADLQVHSPVLLVNWSGTTLLGPVDAMLAVYSSGRATYSALDPITGEATMKAQSLTGEEVEALRMALRSAGAADMCDQAQIVYDVPLRTVTVFDGEQDALSHTFSYWIESGPYAGVQAIVDAVMKAWFAEPL